MDCIRENMNQCLPFATLVTNSGPAKAEVMRKMMPMVKEMATGVSRRNSRLLGTCTSSLLWALLPNLAPIQPAST